MSKPTINQIELPFVEPPKKKKTKQPKKPKDSKPPFWVGRYKEKPPF